jgi:ribose 5-phosphate isomerase B
MNVLCLGGGIVGESLAMEIIETFLNAKFKPEERYQRRLDKVKRIEDSQRN